MAVLCANFALPLGFETFFVSSVTGSQRNSVNRKARLAEMRPEQLNGIHAPVGLETGSKTPTEIALSIMADVVGKKWRGSRAGVLCCIAKRRRYPAGHLVVGIILNL